VVPEARLVSTNAGLLPEGEGWFVVNAREARWQRHEAFGRWCRFEGDLRFPAFGINLHVLEPGQPNCMYHGEDEQEDFLILAGECLLIVEGQERRLKAWDFVHCPAWAEHVFVGAGSGPCVILMTGSRHPDAGVLYPVSEVALRHGAGVEKETPSPEEAYARFPSIQDEPYDGVLDAKSRS
jgi:uncharacterized cupin superfamily protein